MRQKPPKLKPTARWGLFDPDGHLIRVRRTRKAAIATLVLSTNMPWWWYDRGCRCRKVRVIPKEKP